MATIDQLNAVDQVSGSDLLPLYTQQNGDARKMSLNKLVAWLKTQFSVGIELITQYAAPLTGSTVLVQDDQSSVWLILTPAGALAALTLKLPLLANVVDHQEITVNLTNGISSLSFDANGATIIGAPTSLNAKGAFGLRFDAVMKTWYCTYINNPVPPV